MILCRTIKRMYPILFRATEQTVNMLIKARRECEEGDINESEPELRVLSPRDYAEEEKRDSFKA